jgi:beta-glucanase (GH16 family)
VILLCLTLCFGLLVDPDMVNASKSLTSKSVPAQKGWTLVFQDEFEGNSLNERVWETQFPWGRDRSTVGEMQWYAEDAFKVKDGKLHIIANPLPPGSSHPYASGLISSHKSFATEYGRFEIRCKVPRGKGLWPAFWLLPPDTSWPPEIDVFETIGSDPSTVYMTTHWSEDGQHRKNGKGFTGPDFSEDFHTFAMEWSENTIVWYVDDVERHRVKNRSPKGPMYLLTNLAVGGPWPGAPDEATRFPATYEVDYIRVYKADPDAGTDPGTDREEPAPTAGPGNDREEPVTTVGPNNDKKDKNKKKNNKNKKDKKKNKKKKKKAKRKERRASVSVIATSI